MYKETDLTNIKCDKCQTPIAYETVSFQGMICTIGKQHATEYAIKCSKCKKGYGPWNKFDLSLFPNFPDPDKCPCRELCYYCGYNRKSEKCCNRQKMIEKGQKKMELHKCYLGARPKAHEYDDINNDIYECCLVPGCESENPSILCPHKYKVEVKDQSTSDSKTADYGQFSSKFIMDAVLKPLRDYSNEPVNMFAYPSKYEPIDKLNLKALEYPFSFINDNDMYYKPSEICTGLVNEEPIHVGDFPNNIVEYYWIHEGSNDEENWYLFCKVTTKEGEEAYVYYTAGCNYTGFDCQGDMKIYISRNAPALLDSLDKGIQDKLILAKGICTRKNDSE